MYPDVLRVLSKGGHSNQWATQVGGGSSQVVYGTELSEKIDTNQKIPGSPNGLCKLFLNQRSSRSLSLMAELKKAPKVRCSSSSAERWRSVTWTIQNSPDEESPETDSRLPVPVKRSEDKKGTSITLIWFGPKWLARSDSESYCR